MIGRLRDDLPRSQIEAVEMDVRKRQDKLDRQRKQRQMRPDPQILPNPTHIALA